MLLRGIAFFFFVNKEKEPKRKTLEGIYRLPAAQAEFSIVCEGTNPVFRNKFYMMTGIFSGS